MLQLTDGGEMSKIRLLADAIALGAACVGVGAAYLQYKENQKIVQVMINVQGLLYQSARDGKLDLDVANDSINKLGRVTGSSPKPIVATKLPNPSPSAQPTIEALSPDPAPALKRGELQLKEGITLDLFKEGLMYTVDSITDRAVFLHDASSSTLVIGVGEREEIPGTGCSVDLLATHPDDTFKKKGTADLRTWCP